MLSDVNDIYYKFYYILQNMSPMKKKREIVAWRDWQGAAFVSPIP